MKKSDIIDIAKYLPILFLAYLLTVYSQALFITTIPLDDNFCKEFQEVEIDEGSFSNICVAFKNKKSEEIYYHNFKMLDRNKYIIISVCFFCSIICLLFFYYIPKIKGNNLMYDSAVKQIIYGLIIGLVGPIIFSQLLNPKDITPEFIIEVNENNIKTFLLK